MQNVALCVRPAEMRKSVFASSTMIHQFNFPSLDMKYKPDRYTTRCNATVQTDLRINLLIVSLLNSQFYLLIGLIFEVLDQLVTQKTYMVPIF